MPTPRRRRTVPLVFGAIVLALILIPNAIELSTDWYWFRELGYLTVFRTELLLKLGLFFGAGLVAFAVLYGNLRLAQRGLVPDPVVVRLSPAAPHVDITALLRRLALPAAVALAFVIAISVSAAWLDVLAYAHRSAFGVADPIFGRDVGYYVFTMPVLGAALSLASALVVLSTLLLLPVYWLRGDIIFAPRHVRVEPTAQWHLGLLLATFFLITAVRIWFLRIPGLLYSTTGPLVGASYTDLAAELPALRLQAAVALLAAVAIGVGAWRRTVVWNAALAAGAYIAVWLIAGALWPAALQRLVVAPNELDRETPQLAHHIEFTRRAWGLNDVTTRELSGEATLSAADLERNSTTLENVRLWDREPLLQTFGQLQAIRTYYDFESVDDDRYWIDGRYRQVLLSPARAELGGTAHAHLHQPASHLHAWHGAHARARERGDERGAAGAPREGSAPRVAAGAQDHAPADLLRRADGRLGAREHRPA